MDYLGSVESRPSDLPLSPPEVYLPPEHEGSSKDSGHPWSVDMWGLGCLIWEVYNGPLHDAAQLKDVKQLPRILVPQYARLMRWVVAGGGGGKEGGGGVNGEGEGEGEGRALSRRERVERSSWSAFDLFCIFISSRAHPLHPLTPNPSANPKNRPSPKQFLETNSATNKYLGNEFIVCNLFLAELAVKDANEVTAFYQALPQVRRAHAFCSASPRPLSRQTQPNALALHQHHAPPTPPPPLEIGQLPAGPLRVQDPASAATGISVRRRRCVQRQAWEAKRALRRGDAKRREALAVPWTELFFSFMALDAPPIDGSDMPPQATRCWHPCSRLESTSTPRRTSSASCRASSSFLHRRTVPRASTS